MSRRRGGWVSVDEVDDDDDDEDDDGYPKPFIIISSSDDDDEANEDLSLRIVEKSLSMRSRVAHSKGFVDSVEIAEVSGRGSASDVIFNSNEFSSQAAAGSLIKKINGGLIHKIYHRNTAGVEPHTNICDTGAGGILGSSWECDSGGKDSTSHIPHSLSERTRSVIGETELIITDEADGVDASDNTVLRNLLRGPRYFDLQDGVWDLCVNCGQRGHTSGECTSLRNRKKPCFICGSLEHEAKMCSEGKGCFTCKSAGHRAKDCPEKRKRASSTPNICLKCGNYGHDLFSCTTDYTFDDLKEIQCYICKDFGHLCCAKSPRDGPREVSCYHCGQLGHTGLGCTKMVGVKAEMGGGSSSPVGPCFSCGEQGHFARECTRSVKKRGLSTPTKPPKKDRSGSLGKSEPGPRPRKRDYDRTVTSTPKNKGGYAVSKRVEWRQQHQYLGTPPASIRGVRSWSPSRGWTPVGFRGGMYDRFGGDGFDWRGWEGRNYPPPCSSVPPLWHHPDGFITRGFNHGW